MPVCFLDSSTLVKCYVAETGSAWTRSLLDDENTVVYLASLSKVETISALTRRFNRGDISQEELDIACEQFRLDLSSQFEIVDLTTRLIEEAATLARRRGLRAYDAVQLAAAIDTNGVVSQLEPNGLTLISADLELNETAVAAGSGLLTSDAATFVRCPMKILLDECTPHVLKQRLPDFQITTVQELGWAGITNGKLLALAKQQFGVFVTTDKNLRFQQNLTGMRMAIIELPTNQVPVIAALAPAVETALTSISPGDYIQIPLP